MTPEDNQTLENALAKSQEVHDTEERLKKEYEAKKAIVKEGH